MGQSFPNEELYGPLVVQIYDPRGGGVCQIISCPEQESSDFFLIRYLFYLSQLLCRYGSEARSARAIHPSQSPLNHTATKSSCRGKVSSTLVRSILCENHRSPLVLALLPPSSAALAALVLRDFLL